MTYIGVETTSQPVDDRSWDLSPHGSEPGTTPSITLDVSAFTAATHYPDGYIPSGTPLGKITATGLYGPYAGRDNEVAVITRTATGGTVEITLDGETNAGVSIVAATTAADVLAALEALSNVNAGDVTVTGDAGGPFTVTFVDGPYAGADAPDLTIDDTNATGGTVTVAITDGGSAASNGLETCAGLLFAAVKVPDLTDDTKDAGGALKVHGFVDASKLPVTLDDAGQSDLTLIHFA